MNDRLRYFEAIHDGFLYRVFIGASELICVRLGSGFVVDRPSMFSVYLGMFIGTFIGLIPCIAYIIFRFFLAVQFLQVRGTGTGVGAGVLVGGLLCMLVGIGIGKILQANQKTNLGDDAAHFEKGVQEDLAGLVKLDADDIREYIREKKRGFTILGKKVVDAKMDYVGVWRRLFLGRPDPALIIETPAMGKLKFVFRKRGDVVAALHEIEELLGDRLEIGLNMDEYENALKKYRKVRDA